VVLDVVPLPVRVHVVPRVPAERRSEAWKPTLTAYAIPLILVVLGVTTLEASPQHG